MLEYICQAIGLCTVGGLVFYWRHIRKAQRTQERKDEIEKVVAEASIRLERTRALLNPKPKVLLSEREHKRALRQEREERRRKKQELYTIIPSLPPLCEEPQEPANEPGEDETEYP